MSQIFADTAPAYYAKGLSAIPLHPNDKRPIPLKWSTFHKEPVPADTQADWLHRYPNANIGLVCGSQSRVVMVDIDSEDEAIVNLIVAALPQSPWMRKGRKGMVLAFKYSGLPTFRVKNSDGETLVEHLSDGTQVVLPPSIHPQTRRPYTANCELLSVIDGLPSLPDNIEEILRSRLREANVRLTVSGMSKITEYVSKGSRDVKMTSMAGLYAMSILRGERSLQSAIQELTQWCESFVEKSADGDNMDPQKAITNLTRFLKRDLESKQRPLPIGWDEGLTDEDKTKLGLGDLTREDIEWTYQELKEWVVEQRETLSATDEQGALKVADKALRRMAISASMSTMEQEKFLIYLNEVYKIKIGVLRNQLKEIRRGGLKGQDHTEVARAVIAEFNKNKPEEFEGEMLRYHNDQFWIWSGSHWDRLDKSLVMTKIAADFGHMQAAKKYNDHKGILQVMANLVPRTLQHINVPGVNFANGYLTTDLELKPHNPDYGAIYTLPFRYLPDQASRIFKFQSFLERCWGEDADYEEKMNALQECIAMTLFGRGTSVQRAVLLYGPGGTGKSTLLEVIESLVPDGARSYCSPQKWADKFETVTMADSLLNVCYELSERDKIRGDMFKTFIDGSEVNLQYKGGQLFKSRLKATHWFASNYLPKTDDFSSGFLRRWICLGFHKPIGTQRVLDFSEMLIREEREAIIAWAALGAPRFMKRADITLPPSHNHLMREVSMMGNTARSFFESGSVEVTKDEADFVTGQALWNAYYNYCSRTQGVRTLGPSRFVQAMRDLSASFGFKMQVSQQNNAGIGSYEFRGVKLHAVQA
jgi:putative DNA primase/helicase